MLRDDDLEIDIMTLIDDENETCEPRLTTWVP